MSERILLRHLRRLRLSLTRSWDEEWAVMLVSRVYRGRRRECFLERY